MLAPAATGPEARPPAGSGAFTAWPDSRWCPGLAEWCGLHRHRGIGPPPACLPREHGAQLPVTQTTGLASVDAGRHQHPPRIDGASELRQQSCQGSRIEMPEARLIGSRITERTTSPVIHVLVVNKDCDSGHRVRPPGSLPLARDVPPEAIAPASPRDSARGGRGRISGLYQAAAH